MAEGCRQTVELGARPLAAAPFPSQVVGSTGIVPRGSRHSLTLRLIGSAGGPEKSGLPAFSALAELARRIRHAAIDVPAHVHRVPTAPRVLRSASIEMRQARMLIVLHQHEVLDVDAEDVLADVVDVVALGRRAVERLPDHVVYSARSAGPISQRAHLHLRPPATIKRALPDVAAVVVDDDPSRDPLQYRPRDRTARAWPNSWARRPCGR